MNSLTKNEDERVTAIRLLAYFRIFALILVLATHRKLEMANPGTEELVKDGFV